MPARPKRRVAGRRRPEPSVAARLDAATRHRARGRRAQCFALCQDVLDARPGHPDALKLLAGLAREAGQHDAALDFAAAALFAAPRDPDLHVEYALAREAQGCAADAELAHHRAIACEPTAEAFGHLARLLAAGHRHDEALDAASAALDLAPDAAAHRRLGAILAELGRGGDAAAHYVRALALDPRDGDAHFALGRLALAAGDAESAARALRACLRVDPADSRGAAGLLRRIEGRAPRPRVPAGELEKLVRRLLGARTRLAILELGCGKRQTPWRADAARLEAVDADWVRIGGARLRARHDALHAGPPLEHLAALAPSAWDLLVAPEALIGTAALGRTFADAARALRPGGIFAFALRANDRGTDIAILPGGDVRHGEAYVRSVAERVGLQTAALERARPRRAGDPPMLIAALRRGGGG